jgi:uncharacterized protein (DUF2062 family)
MCKLKTVFQPIKQVLIKLFNINDTPQKISLGFAVGVFLGIIPGTGPLAAFVAASLFRINRTSALIGSIITNTWISIISFLLAVKIGCAIMSIDLNKAYSDWLKFLTDFHWINLLKLSFLKLALPVIAGYLVIAFCLGLAVYLITLPLIIRLRNGKAKVP